MPAAARVTDLHYCAMTQPVPHQGGPVQTGYPKVHIGFQDAARVGDEACCEGGTPDKLLEGAATVKIGGQPAVRKGDHTLHGGVVVSGCETVLIGSSPQTVVLLKASGPLVAVCEPQPGDRER